MTRAKPAAVVAAALMLAAAAAIWACPADAAPAATISLTGDGAVSARPDAASVNGGVVTEAAEAKTAVQRNAAAVSALFKALQAFGVAERDMRTAGYNVSPVYGRPEPGKAAEIRGYRVSNTVAVRVRDLSRLGALLDRMVAAGANRMNGVRFFVADPGKLLDEARRRAVADAHRKAELYAEAAGGRVGRVLSIRETGAAPPRPLLRTMLRSTAGQSVPVAAGEQTIRASVVVTYRLK